MAAIITEGLWAPPEGMRKPVANAWRAFYSDAVERYALTPAEYRFLYLAQRGRCWICRKAKGIHPDDPKGGGTRRLGVDHNHVTGQVRGLLCTGGPTSVVPGCNWIIGIRGPDALRRAADYLDGTRTPALVSVALGWNQEAVNAALWAD